MVATYLRHTYNLVSKCRIWWINIRLDPDFSGILKKVETVEKAWKRVIHVEQVGKCWKNRTKPSRHKQQTKKVCPFQVVQLFSSCFNLFQLFQRLFPLLNLFKFCGNFWIFHGEHDKRAWKIDCGWAFWPSLQGNGRMKKQSKSAWFRKYATAKKCPS